MISPELIQQKLQYQALKERMVLDSILILDTVESIQNQIEKKMLEIDEAQFYNRIDELQSLRKQILELLAKLHREEIRMDEYMVKYRKLINEKEALVSSTRKRKPICIRGVPPNQSRFAESSALSGKDEEVP